MLAKEARPATPSACDEAGLTCLTSGRDVRGSERARRATPGTYRPRTGAKERHRPSLLARPNNRICPKRARYDRITRQCNQAARRATDSSALPTRDCHHARQPAAERPSSRLRAVDTQAVPAGQRADGRSGPLQTASRGDHARSTFVDNLFDSHTVLNYALVQNDYNNPAGPPPPQQNGFTYRPRTIGITATFRN